PDRRLSAEGCLLAIKDASKKWSMPIQNWRLAMSRFIIEFGDRLSDHL
ncbi:transposase, partial [Yersinia pestis biovar Antiqua str. B42003004]